MNKKFLKIALTGILTLSITTSNFNYANAYNIKVVDVLPSSEDVKLEIIESSSKIVEVKVRAKKDVQNMTNNVIEENYSINEQNYDFMFDEYGQPASISSAYETGNVTIKLTIVD